MHRVLNISTDYAFALHSKARVPYHIFIEVEHTEAQTHSYYSSPNLTYQATEEENGPELLENVPFCQVKNEEQIVTEPPQSLRTRTGSETEDLDEIEE
jgi:hypothetical protein